MLIISVWKVFGAFKNELLSESLRKFAIFWMTKQLFLNGFVLKWISSLCLDEMTSLLREVIFYIDRNHFEIYVQNVDLQLFHTKMIVFQLFPC